MASAERRGAAADSPSQAATRLQRRAPSSIQISRPAKANWNVAIPLLSPLVSPCSSASCLEEVDVLMAENRAREEARSRDHKASTVNKWKHPAAPFYYGPPPRAKPFVPV